MERDSSRDGERITRRFCDKFEIKHFARSIPDPQRAMLDNVMTEWADRPVAYKDVTNQFIIADYVKRFPDKYNILWIDRPLEDAVFSWMFRRWAMEIRINEEFWDCRDHVKAWNENVGRVPEILMEGAIEVRDYFVPFVTCSVDYDDVVTDETVIPRALEQMGYDAFHIPYINDKFIAKREKAMLRRNSKGWRKLRELYETRRERHQQAEGGCAVQSG